MKTLLLSAFIAIMGAASALLAQTYQVTDLGALAGVPTYATAINDDGIVCGYAQPTATTAKAWVFANNLMTELSGLGGSEARALAVGADGRVFGYATDAAGLAHAMRWENGVGTDLGPASGTEGWFPQAVNAGGTVAGYTGTAVAPVSAFTLSLSSFTFLPPLIGATPPATSAAYGINAAGQVVGVASWVGGGTRAFRTDGAGALVSLGTLGANDSFAAAINAAGDVAGYSVNAGNAMRAFVFTDAGGMKDLGGLAGGVESRAYAINDSGFVVGASEDAAGVSRAIYYGGSGALRDLNELIPPLSGWVLAEAHGINAGGDIAGFGTVGGETHAFIAERFDGLDTLAPVAVATATQPGVGATSTTVTVKFWDNEKVVTSTTHSFGTIRISGPNFYDMPGTANSWFSTDAQQMTVTFTVPAPGGSWDGGDNGTYEIRLATNQVSDLAGNVHPGGVIGTFTVGLQTAPALNYITLPATTTLGAAVNLAFGAFGSYPAAAGDLFTVSVDWDGDGAAWEAFAGRASGASIAHTFTSTGTHTVRVRVTDPHGIQSGERTAQIAVANAALPLLGEAVATPVGYYGGYTSGVVAAESAGTFYFFGGYPLDNDNSPAVTWNYATPNAPFVFRGNFDNGPIQFEGAGVDGRGRIVVYGGHEPLASATTSAFTFTIAGGAGGGVAAKPNAAYGASARDNLGRLYSISSATMMRYNAEASGNGTWSTLAAPGFTPTCAAYDGAGHLIAFSGTAVMSYDIATGAWTALASAPAAIAQTALGADGLLYGFSGVNVYVFNPATTGISILGTLAQDHTGAPVLPGNDGYLYLVGNDTIERLDTRAATTRAPRITSTPTGTTTLSIGNEWTYTLAASGKPAPTFSIVRGPAGMSVNAATGAVAWTPSGAQAGTQTALVRASNSAGAADQLITFTVLGMPPDLTPPTAPTNLAAFNIATNSADISWTGSTDNVGVTGYRIFERRTAYSGRGRPYRVYYSQIGATAGTSWHFANLPACSTRTYYVGALDAAGNLSAKAAVTFTLQCPPAIYADQSGTFQGLRAIVSEPWTGNVFTATGNPLPALTPGASPAGAVWHIVSGSSGYFTWTPAAGQEGAQTFTVNAASVAGSASFSRTVTVYPAGTDLIPPSAPASVVVDQVSFESCRIAWSPATDNYGIAAYRVVAAHRQPRRRFHNGPYDDHVLVFNLPPTAAQQLITGLRPSTSYQITVQAVDAAGLWGSAAGSSITTLLQPFVLAAAQTATVLNGDGSMTMTWPGYGYYWKFTVECSEDLVTWIPVPPASQWPNYATTFTFTPEPGVAQRFYRVRAIAAATP